MMNPTPDIFISRHADNLKTDRKEREQTIRVTHKRLYMGTLFQKQDRPLTV